MLTLAMVDDFDVVMIGVFSALTTGFLTALGMSFRVNGWKQRAHKAERKAESYMLKKAEWKVRQKVEKWGPRDPETGEVKNTRSGMAVYCTSQDSDWSGSTRDLPVGHVYYDADDFMSKLAELRGQAEERCAELNAVETPT